MTYTARLHSLWASSNIIHRTAYALFMLLAAAYVSYVVILDVRAYADGEFFSRECMLEKRLRSTWGSDKIIWRRFFDTMRTLWHYWIVSLVAEFAKPFLKLLGEKCVSVARCVSATVWAIVCNSLSLCIFIVQFSSRLH
jgi:hypothetical protein